MTTPDLSGKTIVVTGASSGIGRATASALGKMGARLVLTGRTPERCKETAEALRQETGRDDVEMVQGDQSTRAGVKALAEEILERAPRIDVLVNNAGVTLLKRQETADGTELTFATNHLGYFGLTGRLLPRLLESGPARIVSVASDAHRFAAPLDLDDLQNERQFKGMQVYGQSKAANILWNLELARRLEGTEITANCLHPGGVNTNLGAGAGPILDLVQKVVMRFMKSPDEGAATSVYLASSSEVDGVNGRYWYRCKEHTPKPWARDPEVARRLWGVSEELSGVTYPELPSA